MSATSLVFDYAIASHNEMCLLTPHSSTFADRRVWYEAAAEGIEARVRDVPGGSGQMARGVVLFVGDGMGMSTLTAARILYGQRRGNTGEEAQLAWDRFPAVALARVSFLLILIVVWPITELKRLYSKCPTTCL